MKDINYNITKEHFAEECPVIRLGSKENPFRNAIDIWRYSQQKLNRQNAGYLEFIYVSKQVVISPHLEIELKKSRILVTVVENKRNTDVKEHS